jgi:hypothetical protein
MFFENELLASVRFSASLVSFMRAERQSESQTGGEGESGQRAHTLKTQPGPKVSLVTSLPFHSTLKEPNLALTLTLTLGLGPRSNVGHILS